MSMTRSQRLRSKEQAVWVALGWSASVPVFIWGLAEVPTVSARLFIVGLAVTWSTVVGAALLSCAWFSADALVIQNLFRRRYAPLNRVTQFRIERWVMFPAVCVAHLEDGSRLPILGIQAPNPAFRRTPDSLRSVLECMNRRLNRHPG
jgi:hypothetical protein